MVVLPPQYRPILLVSHFRPFFPLSAVWDTRGICPRCPHFRNMSWAARLRIPELGAHLLFSGTVCASHHHNPDTVSYRVVVGFGPFILLYVADFAVLRERCSYRPPSISGGRLAIRTRLVPIPAISMRTGDIAGLECLYSDWPFVVYSTSCTYCRPTIFMNTCRRGPSIIIMVTVASATCSCSRIHSCISYADIRGLYGSKVHTRVLYRSSMALHSNTLPPVRHAHTVNKVLHYYTTYFHRNSLARSTVQT